MAIDFSGVSGKLKTLLDRVPATLSATLTAISDAVATRAPASTALSNVTWPAEKAGFINAAITSRLGAIKAVYIGSVNIAAGQTTGAASLGATVNPAKCLLIGTGVAGGMNGWNVPQGGFLSGLTATQVQATTNGTINSAMSVGYCVVEFA